MTSRLRGERLGLDPPRRILPLDKGTPTPKNGLSVTRLGAQLVPFRLQIVHGERIQRIPLTEGEWVVGSSADADIRINRPTVSRRHAMLVVGEDGVEVEDLGSTNGTRIDGEPVRKRTELPLDKQVLFGTAVAQLESLVVQDSEVGIPLDGSTVRARRVDDEDAASSMATMGPSVLENFTFVFLPEVLETMGAEVSPTDRIQVIGAGLFECLPCRSVEISRDTGDGEAVVFSAERDRIRYDNGEGSPIGVSCEEWVVRVVFPVENLAQAYEPLVRSGALLIGMGPGTVKAKTVAGRKRRPGPDLPEPSTVSPVVRGIYSAAGRIAAGSISVLIRGESGTGKELLARYIHAASPRAQAPLVTLNCAALSRDLLEAELFGVEKGVATGVDSRPGRFEQAHGGTLFLDEIGDMAPETQAKILRVLQEKEVFRLGSGSPKPAEVRVVSATNLDIDALLENGTFRSDLFHRIADWVVELPPLRRRREDIPNLAVHFLSAACNEVGVAPAGISRAALDVLKTASWPGNIRQLEREMSRVALFLEDGDLLESTLLQGSLFGGAGFQDENQSLKDLLENAERTAIERALIAADGDVAQAAEHLEIGRSTLYRRMTALEIRDQSRENR